jgi:hypothetical protein
MKSDSTVAIREQYIEAYRRECARVRFCFGVVLDPACAIAAGIEDERQAEKRWKRMRRRRVTGWMGAAGVALAALSRHPEA